MAEGVGFEPTVSCPTHALQACRFVRSRIPPEPRVRLADTLGPRPGRRTHPTRGWSVAATRANLAAASRPPGEVATGSCATAVREPGQGREAAAFSGACRVPQITWSPPQPAGGSAPSGPRCDAGPDEGAHRRRRRRASNLTIDELGAVRRRPRPARLRLGLAARDVPRADVRPARRPGLRRRTGRAGSSSGTHLIVPGRNVVPPGEGPRRARPAVAVDGSCITAVVGLDDPAERAVAGPARRATAASSSAAMLPELRDLWAGDAVDGATLPVRPLQDPLEVWMGGRQPSGACSAPGGCRTAGCRAACRSTEAAAAQGRDRARPPRTHGRAISPEHFGTNISYARRPLPDDVRAAMAARLPGRRATSCRSGGPGAAGQRSPPGSTPGSPSSSLRPAVAPADWRAELEQLADDVLDLQT